MKKMTKVISLALALVMCLALCACGSKKEASYKMLDEKVSTEQRHRLCPAGPGNPAGDRQDPPRLWAAWWST